MSLCLSNFCVDIHVLDIKLVLKVGRRSGGEVIDRPSTDESLDMDDLHAELLNDVAYVDYTIGGLNPRFGWADVPTAFCDSMLFWCLTCASLMRKPEEIGRFLSLIHAPFAMVADELPGVIIKYVYSGLCGELSFQQELPLNTVIRCVRQEMRLLEESTVILHDIDIAVDCALISTRAIIKEYLMTLGVTDRDIADDVKDVGLNCISWRRYTTSVPPLMLRTKTHNIRPDA
ncbi:hypothetical protein VTP01DRAFT_8077 [Rhizomucor pusillus]|uniref:uncharacterized protein n=1 Tax=Rhizomucor pusillus TaxID=4840 RepID=UPI0037423F59